MLDPTINNGVADLVDGVYNRGNNYGQEMW